MLSYVHIISVLKADTETSDLIFTENQLHRSYMTRQFTRLCKN